jgi:hypothetical protein
MCESRHRRHWERCPGWGGIRRGRTGGQRKDEDGKDDSSFHGVGVAIGVAVKIAVALRTTSGGSAG